MTTTVNTEIAELDSLFEGAQMKTNCQGNAMWETFLEEGDRYRFDWLLHDEGEGWKQFDTDSDASYFGVWLNKSGKLVLSYAEGDLSVTQCDTDSAYNREVAALCAFHAPAPFAKALGEDGWTHYYQDRSELFIIPKQALAAFSDSNIVQGTRAVFASLFIEEKRISVDDLDNEELVLEALKEAEKCQIFSVSETAFVMVSNIGITSSEVREIEGSKMVTFEHCPATDDRRRRFGLRLSTIQSIGELLNLQPRDRASFERAMLMACERGELQQIDEET